MVAAGANEAQLSDGETKATDRVMSGDVPAAVLALVSSEAATDSPKSQVSRFFEFHFRLLVERATPMKVATSRKSVVGCLTTTSRKGPANSTGQAPTAHLG